jgi:hypothetical protein
MAPATPYFRSTSALHQEFEGLSGPHPVLPESSEQNHPWQAVIRAVKTDSLKTQGISPSEESRKSD